MKIPTLFAFALAAAWAAVSLTGCSSTIGTGGPSDKEISSQGPTVLYVRADPETIILGQELKPQQTAEILADVKDFRDKVTDVKFRFTNVPLEIKMKNIGGTTWRAELTPEQLKKLAVRGQTMKYEAEVVAKNSKGEVATSEKPTILAIQAPEVGGKAKTG